MYGSLRSGFNSDAYRYVSRYFNLVGTAKVKGVLFDLGDYPAALPTTNDAFIIGELYTIKNETEFEWAIEQLDDYEGLHVELGETQLYRRELVDVFCNDNTIQAWIYWCNQTVENKPLIESGDVMEYFKSKQK